LRYVLKNTGFKKRKKEVRCTYSVWAPSMSPSSATYNAYA